MIKDIGILLMIMAQFASATMLNAQPHSEQNVQSYIYEKLDRHDIVFVGTIHQQPAILRQMAGLIAHLHETGVTHLALEVASDQQDHIDGFLASGRGLARIALHKAVDCPQYRNLFKILRRLHPNRRPAVVAIDLPGSQYGGAVTRNQYMAIKLASVVQSQPDAKVLTMLGSLHVLRKLKWNHRADNGHLAVRTHLEQMMPELKMFSVVHLVDTSGNNCDFSRRLSPLTGNVAIDLDQRFKGWRLGITDCLAVRPSQPYELVDGVIIHPLPPVLHR
ncbi:MAG: hypothetical protein PVH87_13625 [Desulfobacteraceae bacterium]|jgi:uncharacterized iron-regulated protein